MQVIGYLSEHKAAFLHAATTPMSAFVDTDKHPVITCVAAGTVRDVLTVLVTVKISGVAIVDAEGGNIVGNMSLSDMRRLHKCSNDDELNELLGMNVMKFLAHATAADVLLSVKPLTLGLDDSLGTAIELLAASKA